MVSRSCYLSVVGFRSRLRSRSEEVHQITIKRINTRKNGSLPRSGLLAQKPLVGKIWLDWRSLSSHGNTCRSISTNPSVPHLRLLRNPTFTRFASHSRASYFVTRLHWFFISFIRPSRGPLVLTYWLVSEWDIETFHPLFLLVKAGIKDFRWWAMNEIEFLSDQCNILAFPTRKSGAFRILCQPAVEAFTRGIGSQ